MGLRGPAKQFHKEARIDLTELQFTYLQTVGGNESVAAVVRELISADLRRRLAQEMTSAKRRKRSGTTAVQAR
jgi:hypothetical protein